MGCPAGVQKAAAAVRRPRDGRSIRRPIRWNGRSASGRRCAAGPRTVIELGKHPPPSDAAEPQATHVTGNVALERGEFVLDFRIVRTDASDRPAGPAERQAGDACREPAHGDFPWRQREQLGVRVHPRDHAWAAGCRRAASRHAAANDWTASGSTRSTTRSQSARSSARRRSRTRCSGESMVHPLSRSRHGALRREAGLSRSLL